jgi:signal transduction histidine kinase
MPTRAEQRVPTNCKVGSLYFLSSQGILGVTSMALLEYQQNLSKGAQVDETMYENICTIQASSQLLLTLINNMLDVRKMGSGMMESLQMEIFDLVSCIRLSERYIKQLTMVSGVTLDIGAVDRQRLVLGTPLRVQQVLINLIGNAVKYSSSSSFGTTAGVNKIDLSVRRSTVDEARQEAYEALCTSLNKKAYSPVEDVPGCTPTASRSWPAVIVDILDYGDGIPVDEAHKVFAEFIMLKKHVGETLGFAQPTGNGLG